MGEAAEGAIEYRWLPRPAARPAGLTPYAPIDAPETSAPRRLRNPPPVGDRVGGVVFPKPAAGPEPAREQKQAGVILVGEWWGIDSHVLQLGRSIAAAGFDVVCLDIFRDGPGAIPVDVRRRYHTAEGLRDAFAESAHKMKTCDWASALVDVAAAAEWLRHEEGGAGTAGRARSDSVAVVGCSFGAVLALLAAAASRTADQSNDDAVCEDTLPPPPVDAAVAFYGLPEDRFTGGSARLWDAARVGVPCQLHFPSAAPGLEGFDDVARGRALLDELRAAAAGSGRSHELHEYLVRPCRHTHTHRQRERQSKV